MSKIFISYRRDDSLPWAARLHEHLSRHFGAKNVFIDIDAIEPGEDFAEVVRDKVEACSVFVPVIGRNWLTCLDKMGHKRLEDPEDYVRIEIATALRLGLLDAQNSPTADVDIMKRKRIIDDARKQYPEPGRGLAVTTPTNVRPNLGVLVESVNASFAQGLGLKNPLGAMIAEVARGSSAERAGLQRGDVIVRFNAQIVRDMSDFERWVAESAPDKAIDLDVWRLLGENVATLTVQVTLPKNADTETRIRTLDQRTVDLEVASAIAKKYDETAREAIRKINN